MLRVQSNIQDEATHKNSPRFKTNGIFVKISASDNWLSFWAHLGLCSCCLNTDQIFEIKYDIKFLVETLSFKGYYKEIVTAYKVYIFSLKLSYT